MFSLRPVASYLDHLFHATTKHGVHSPFVFRLITEVLTNSTRVDDHHDIEILRERLLRDKREIEVLDLGAGSRMHDGSVRRISDIARSALRPRAECELVGRLVNEFQPRTALELGTSFGITTTYIARTAPDASIITIEGCPNVHAIAQENFKKLKVERIDAIQGSFDAHLDGALKKLVHLDFLYVDGDHRFDSTIRYFETCLPYLHAGSVVLFDDIHWNKHMERAWQQIIEDKRVIVSIDLYRSGLVFVGRDQAKEHFRIRI